MFTRFGPCFDISTDGGLVIPQPAADTPVTVEGRRVLIETKAGRIMLDPAAIAAVLPSDLGQCAIVFRGGGIVGCNIASSIIIDAAGKVPQEPNPSDTLQQAAEDLRSKIAGIDFAAWPRMPAGPRDAETSTPAAMTDAQRQQISSGGHIPAGSEV